MLALANGFTLPVTAAYLTGPPGSPADMVSVVDVPVAAAAALFLLLSSLFHLLVAAPGLVRRYTGGRPVCVPPRTPSRS